jgi:hypothetical protein
MIGWAIRGVTLAPQTAERSRSSDRRAQDRRIAAAVAQIGQRNGAVRENPRGYRKLDYDNDNDNDNDNDKGREVRRFRNSPYKKQKAPSQGDGAFFGGRRPAELLLGRRDRDGRHRRGRSGLGLRLSGDRGRGRAASAAGTHPRPDT